MSNTESAFWVKRWSIIVKEMWSLMKLKILWLISFNHDYVVRTLYRWSVKLLWFTTYSLISWRSPFQRQTFEKLEVHLHYSALWLWGYLRSCHLRAKADGIPQWRMSGQAQALSRLVDMPFCSRRIGRTSLRHTQQILSSARSGGMTGISSAWAHLPRSLLDGWDHRFPRPIRIVHLLLGLQSQIEQQGLLSRGKLIWFILMEAPVVCLQVWTRFSGLSQLRKWGQILEKGGRAIYDCRRWDNLIYTADHLKLGGSNDDPTGSEVMHPSPTIPVTLHHNSYLFSHTWSPLGAVVFVMNERKAS